MKWKSIKSAPKDGTKIDLWIHIYASPRSFGMADSFRTLDCWYQDGHWVHYHEGKVAELFDDYVTHWMPISPPPKRRTA